VDSPSEVIAFLEALVGAAEGSPRVVEEPPRAVAR
jgi:hypothetical protein